MSKQALGKGFDGLIPTGFNVSDVATPGESIKELELSKIVTNPDQPRKSFDDKALQELAASIKQHGIIQPLVVTPYKNEYRIVAGERRYRAARLAGLKKAPAIVRNHKELEELEVALVENVQRVDLSPLETAVSIVRLRDQFSLSTKDISKKLGKAETTISNIIRLLQLPKQAVVALQKNQISEGHARAILALKTDKHAQEKLLNKIIVQKISVRDAEQYVKDSKPNTKLNTKLIAKTNELVIKAQQSLGTPIKVTTRKKGGDISIRYTNDDQLNDILSQLHK